MNASVALPKAGMQPSPANIQLMQLTTAYWTSRCLHVVAELGVADHLGDQPQSTESLAKATGTGAGPLYRVLRLLASVGVFQWRDGTWHHTGPMTPVLSAITSACSVCRSFGALSRIWITRCAPANPRLPRDMPAAFLRTWPRTRKRAASSTRRSEKRTGAVRHFGGGL